MLITTNVDSDFKTDGLLKSTTLSARATTKGNMAGIAITTFSGYSCEGKGMPYPNIQYGYNYAATVQSLQFNRPLNAGEQLDFSVFDLNGNCNNGRYTETVKTTMGPGCYGVVNKASCFRLSHH